jgi:hypothetical protein
MNASTQRPSAASSDERIVATYEEDLEFAAAEVWPFFDWPNLHLMQPGGFFAEIDYAEPRPVAGATRTIRLGGVGNGLPLVETLLESDPVAMRLRYRITDPAPMPIRCYEGDVRVESIDAERCRVHFASSCTLSGIDAATWRAAYRDMQRGSLQFIAQTLAQTRARR